MVLISGGYGAGLETSDDLWLLDIESRRCDKVSVIW